MSATQRRRRPVDDDEEVRPRQRRQRQLEQSDEEPSLAAAAEDDSDGEMAGADAKANDLQLAKKLVRYAISCEYSRLTIRRDGIKERVLGNQGRSFKRIFALAQTQLRTAWGMELRELPVREKMTLQEKRQAMKSNSQPKTGSGAYILSSTLPDAYRSAAIIAPSKTPSATEEATYVGFYTLVVSAIWLSGGELSEQKLREYLRRLNADRNVSSEKTETILKRMEKHGYIIKRTDRPPVGQDGELVVTWLVGTRAREEIGLDGVMGMAREVYGDSNPALEKQLRASLGIKNRGGEDDGDGAEEGGDLREEDTRDREVEQNS